MSRATRLQLATLLGILMLCLQLSAALTGAALAGIEFSRIELLAAFLYRIGSYVEWSIESLPDTQASLRLCVVKHKQFGSSLRELDGEPLKGRVLSVRHLNWNDSLDGCHILFDGERGQRGTRLLARARLQRGLLTTSDRPGFACQGGILEFFDRDNSIKLRVNTDAAARAGLEISSNVLSLAEIETDERCVEKLR